VQVFPWWQDAVLCQIHPRSFQGDGVGDLSGITKRLDHLVGLGADNFWLQGDQLGLHDDPPVAADEEVLRYRRGECDVHLTLGAAARPLPAGRVAWASEPADSLPADGAVVVR
jgi:hypothetical protein